ncbi:glycosyltransferase family 2 protein [Elizabethkingia anophelis]|uniref:glycosyltransferase family 2 protein n=1 Tax=Elizabethkingia anophelis TaxID=1117645 RepID=UPI00373104F1
MESYPLVSIIIITMNHEKFIVQACESALQQTYPNIEIIFLDNNSTDKTFERATETISKATIPHTLIKNATSYGVAKNLNILVSKASGKYISILSGDDWYTNDAIEEKVKYLQNNNLDFALSDGYKHYENENKTVAAYSPKQKKHIIQSINNFFHSNVTQNLPLNVGVFIKRELLIKYPFDENIHAEDWDMNLRFTSLGYKIGFIDVKLFYYRILSTSLSRNWDLMEDSYKKITQKYIDYIFANKELKRKYEVNLLKHKYEKMLSKTMSDQEKEHILSIWKKEKYKIKYNHPILFFKLLFLK